MEESRPRNLLVFNKNQEAFFSSAGGIVQEGGTFYLIDHMMRIFGADIEALIYRDQGLSIESIRSGMERFYLKLTGSADILDKSLPAEIFIEDYEDFHKRFNFPAGSDQWLAYFLEFMAIYILIKTWFDPHEVSNGQVKAKHWVNRAENNFYFAHRCREFHSYPTFIGEEFSQLHESHGILPLLWAEMWYGMTNMIKANICPYCHCVYLYPNNNYRKSNCGKASCRRANLIKQHGGLEGYRAWEAERKKKTGGKRGRPRKGEA